MTCPICKSENISGFLTRTSVPVHQNLLMPTRESALSLAKGDLGLSYCKDCSFVFNRTFDQGLLRYGDQYDNNQTCSPLFQNYIDELIEILIGKRNVRNCRIVDVGCGNGYFLSKLIANRELNNTGYGFDPSYSGPVSTCDSRLHFVKYNYDETCADIQADVVICRHVIEHVPDPVSLLKTVKAALVNSPNAKIFFERHE